MGQRWKSSSKRERGAGAGVLRGSRLATCSAGPRGEQRYSQDSSGAVVGCRSHRRDCAGSHYPVRCSSRRGQHQSGRVVGALRGIGFAGACCSERRPLPRLTLARQTCPQQTSLQLPRVSPHENVHIDCAATCGSWRARPSIICFKVVAWRASDLPHGVGDTVDRADPRADAPCCHPPLEIQGCRVPPCTRCAALRAGPTGLVAALPSLCAARAEHSVSNHFDTGRPLNN